MSKENVLVAGANGTTGQIIIELLKDHDHYQPLAMIRKKEQKDKFHNMNVKTVLGDLEKDLSHTVKNIDKVIFAAGSKGKNVIGVDQEGAKTLIDEAEKANVKKFVMLSSMGADKPSISHELKDYLQAKQNADEHLRQKNINYCIIRPGTLTNDEGKGKIELAEKLGRFGKITRADVAKTLVVALDDQVKKNETFEILSGDTSINKALTANS
jgi:uncharacterized protein YbjT (DUF2867 family)